MKTGKKYLVNPAPGFISIVANPKGKRSKAKRRNPTKRSKSGIFVIRKARKNPSPYKSTHDAVAAGNALLHAAKESKAQSEKELKEIRALAAQIKREKNAPMKTRHRRKSRNPLKRRARRTAGGRFVSRKRNPTKRSRKKISRNPMSKKTRRRGSRRRSRNPISRRGARRRSGRRSSRRMRNPLPVVRELFGPDMLSLAAGVVAGTVGTKMIMNRLIAGDPANGQGSFKLPGVNYQVPPGEFYSRNAWVLAFYNLAIGGGAGYLLRNQSPRLARGIMIGSVAGTISDVLRNTGVLTAGGTLQMPQMGRMMAGVGRNYGPGVGMLPGTNTRFTGPAQQFLAQNNVPRPRGMGARVGPNTLAAMASQPEGAFRGAN